jgi:hypothetical protein
MHINNFTLPTPPQALLDKCHKVVIPDGEIRFWKMKRWCRDNDMSLMWADFNDLSEASVFYFIEAADATAFTLKFQ